MTVLNLPLALSFDDFQSGTLWRKYAAANKNEAAACAAYVAALAAGTPAVPPTLTTKTGRGLAGMLAALAPASQVDPQSPAKMRSFPGSLPVFLSADVAVASGTVAYAVQGPSTFDAVVYGPQSLQVGASDDHHLVLRDPVHGRETDFYNPAIGGMIIASGGCSFPIDSPQEPVPGSANAARFPLARGLITPADITAGTINHPLVCSLPRAVIGGPCVYPANQAQPPNPSGAFALGQRFGFPAALDVPALGLPRLETLIVTAIRDHGLYLRDIGEGLIAIYGLDAVNEGGNQAAWGAAGVTLTTSNAAGYPFALELAALPWGQLQVMQPPTGAPW